MKHEKTFEAIAKLKDIEIELHRLKNALEMANKALDAKREWVALTAIHALIPAAVESAGEQIGIDGIKAFFDGYKDLPEILKLAAH